MTFPSVEAARLRSQQEHTPKGPLEAFIDAIGKRTYDLTQPGDVTVENKPFKLPPPQKSFTNRIITVETPSHDVITKYIARTTCRNPEDEPDGRFKNVYLAWSLESYHRNGNVVKSQGLHYTALNEAVNRLIVNAQ